VYYSVDEEFDQPQKVVGVTLVEPLAVQYEERQREKALANLKLDSSDTVIMVSYFLPVTLSQLGGGEWQVTWDLDHTLSFDVPEAKKVIYVGSIRYNDATIPEGARFEVAKALFQFNCLPVFLEEALHHMCYEVFCYQHQWQVLHQKVNVYGGLEELIGDKTADFHTMWVSFCTVQERFRSKVLEAFHHGDLVWVHGHELMLLPGYVRRKIRGASIGFFFHSPFPASDIWLTMFHGDELLRGVLSANQIDFQVYEYCSNFTTSCCRILGYSYYINQFGMIIINAEGHEVAVSSVHKGVDAQRLYDICDKSRFLDEVKKWRERYQHKTIVAAFIKFSDEMKGISINFSEIERFLANRPQWVGRIVFTLIGISPPQHSPMYEQSRQEILGWAKLINGKYGQEIVYYEERHSRDMQLIDRLAYFAAADILLLTVIP
jgi:trehalose 6-phosphate synthase/phosphatase